jgi:hypothetical protein
MEMSYKDRGVEIVSGVSSSRSDEAMTFLSDSNQRPESHIPTLC